MSALLSGYITVAKMEEMLATVKAKGLKGFAFTASVNDDTNEYGQNVSFYAEQSKEQREAKTNKYFFGNGKVFWTDGNIKTGTAAAPKADISATTAKAPSVHDLPF